MERSAARILWRRVGRLIFFPRFVPRPELLYIPKVQFTVVCGGNLFPVADNHGDLIRGQF
jgi:hypothetical protein